MTFTTLKFAGQDAIRELNEHRARYVTTGQYPFLIGDNSDLEKIQESAEFDRRDPERIVRSALDLTVADWIAENRGEPTDWDVNRSEILEEWPGEIRMKGSIRLHKDILTGQFKPEVYLGLTKIDQPWHLPAVLKYGGWNECPEPEIHCAFHRAWYERFGAEITGMSQSVVEVSVAKPPTDPDSAIDLAWEQFCYCSDIVEQGCGSISNLAAVLINSPYWYFWWD